MRPHEIYEGDPEVPEDPPGEEGGAEVEAPAPAWQLPALVGLFVVLVLVLVLSFYMRPVMAPLEETGGRAALQAPRPVQTQVMVYVVGEVRQPGVVALPPGSRVADAVEKAGGLTEKADPMVINLAAKVKDEDKIIIPARGQAVALDPLADLLSPEAAPEGEPSPEFSSPEGEAIPEEPAPASEGPLVTEEDGAAGPAGRKVSLNMATAQDLEAVKGIGPELARRIVEWRQGPPARSFQTVDDLLNVQGIRRATLEKIRPYVDL